MNPCCTKAVEEIKKEVEGMRPWHHCICGSFLSKEEYGYHSCGAFIGNTPSESEGITGYNAALSDVVRLLNQK